MNSIFGPLPVQDVTFFRAERHRYCSTSYHVFRDLARSGLDRWLYCLTGLRESSHYVLIITPIIIIYIRGVRSVARWSHDAGGKLKRQVQILSSLRDPGIFVILFKHFFLLFII